MTPQPPAVVLAAGVGSRLWPLSTRRAKAAVPLAGRPLVERVLVELCRQGITDVVINLHHLPATITGLVGDGTGLGLRVRYSLEPTLLGSAGGPRQALTLLECDTVLLVNADTLTTLDLHDLLVAHRRHGALVTMAVVPMPAGGTYGGVVASADDAVSAFVPRGRASGAWHFVGVQVIEARVLSGLVPGRPADMLRDVYDPLLAARPGAIRIHRVAGEFLDVGTPADYLHAALRLADREQARARLNEGALPGDAATLALTDSVVWPGAHVEDRVRLHRCVVTDGCRLPRGLVAEEAVLVPAEGLTPRPVDIMMGPLLVAPLDPASQRPPRIGWDA